MQHTSSTVVRGSLQWLLQGNAGASEITEFYAEDNDGGKHGMWIHEKAIAAVSDSSRYVFPSSAAVLFAPQQRCSGETFSEL